MLSSDKGILVKEAMYLHTMNNLVKSGIKKSKKVRNRQKKWKMGIPNLKSWHFQASEDIMAKFKSQGLHNARIKYWNAIGSGFTPLFIPAHWNIGILLHKQAKRRTIMHTTVCNQVTVRSTVSGDFPKFCGLLRMYELYIQLLWG